MHLAGRVIRVVKFAFLAILIFLTAYSSSTRHPVAPYAGRGISIHDTSVFKSGLSDTITVATYNIRRGRGTDNIRSLSRTADVIREASADIVGLNEVGGGPFSFINFLKYSQAQTLAENLAMGSLFLPSEKRYHFPYFGNGVLSRVDIKQWKARPLLSQYFDLEHSLSGLYPEHKTRRALTVLQVDAGANEIAVLITHLSREAIQDKQLGEVIEEFKKHRYAILMGDLNLNRHHKQLAFLLKDPGYRDVMREVIGEADDKQYRIDWIISTANLKPLDGGVTQAGVSDHPFYWAKLQIVN